MTYIPQSDDKFIRGPKNLSIESRGGERREARVPHLFPFTEMVNLSPISINGQRNRSQAQEAVPRSSRAQMSVQVIPSSYYVDHRNVIRVAIPRRVQPAYDLGAIRFRRRGGKSSLFGRSFMCCHPSGEAYLPQWCRTFNCQHKPAGMDCLASVRYKKS